MSIQIYTDGGSRGNPGPAAAAVVIRNEQGQPLLEAGFFLGRATNNVAEYMGLIMGLEAAARSHASDVAIFMDSELIVRQITGEYRVKDPRLAELFSRAQHLLLEFDTWQIQHVRREQNKRADALVNKAMDMGGDVVATQVGDMYPDRPAVQRQPDLFAGNGKAAAGREPAGQGTKEGSPGTQGNARGGDARGASAAGASSAGGRGSPPPDPTEVFPVLVRCLSDPRQDACTAGMQQGLEFLFTDATPGGLCLHAAKAVLDTVMAMRYAARRGEMLSPVRVRCRLPNCGAEFEVRMAGK